MISRSLGPEFGGAIGLIFSVANAIAASMYIVGFCESINDLLASFHVKIIDGGVNDVRVVGSVTLVVLFAICLIGMEWEARVSGELGEGRERGVERRWNRWKEKRVDKAKRSKRNRRSSKSNWSSGRKRRRRGRAEEEWGRRLKVKKREGRGRGRGKGETGIEGDVNE